MAIRQDFLESTPQNSYFDQIFKRIGSLVEDLRDDQQMSGWVQTGGEVAAPGNLVLAEPSVLRRQALRASLRDAHGKGVLRMLVKFVIGSGVLVDFIETDKNKTKKLLKWLRKVQRGIGWFSFIREFVHRVFRDGEAFVWRFPPGEKSDDPFSILRFIDPDNVQTINTDPTDVETIINYQIKDWPTPVDPKFILHCKINVDRNVKRGRTFLEPILPLLTKYDKWLEARMLLNIIRTSVALVQEVNGPSTDLFRLRSAQTSNRGATNETDRAKMIRPGTILRGTPGVKYSMLSPNLDAKDAGEDGRTILMAIATAAGVPDVFITADYSKNNFASTIAAQNPAIREFEDWQTFFTEPIGIIIMWLLEDGVEAGEIDTDTDLDFDLAFPPLLKRDIGQETLANQAMNMAGVLSKRSWGFRAGLDPDAEQEQIDIEGGPPIAPQPGQADPNRPRPNIGQPQLGQTNAIPKGVQDRNPRQNVKAESVSEEMEIPEKKKRGRKPKVVVVNVKGEGKIIKPFTLEYENTEEQDNEFNDSYSESGGENEDSVGREESE